MTKKLIEKVNKTIEIYRLLEKNDNIIVGVSGGPDSVCLLSILNELAPRWGLSLHAVHLNHCLRGQHADEDQLYTEELCKKMGIKCYTFRCDVSELSKRKRITSEEAGRLVRYGAFEEVKSKIGGSAKIAVAHNLNDQAETLLMRIIRGTGTDGLSAMDYKRDGGIIRPLLDVDRKEIEKYCEELDLKPRIDLSNLEPIYTRNRIRLQLLPLLEEYNENILETLNRLGKIARQDREYFNIELEKVAHIVHYNTNAKICSIDLCEYGKLHPAIGKRLIASSLKGLGMLQDIAAVHLDGADELMRQGKTGDRLEFPWGYGIILDYDSGQLYGKDSSDDSAITNLSAAEFTYTFKPDGDNEIPELNALIRAKASSALTMECHTRDFRNKDNYTVCLDFDALNKLSCILVRNRRPGDYITPLGMNGRKKLQDFFVDRKIPKNCRDSIPLLCCDDEVIWVIGHGINERFKIKDTTRKIVCLEYISLS